MTEFDPRQKS